MIEATRTGGAIAALLAVITLGAPGAALAAELECEAEGPRDISMDADYEDRGGRQKFSVEFEASRRSEFFPGQRMSVLVKGIEVGAVALRKSRDGDAVGDLELDTEAGRGAEPFPDDFPAVTQGTRVRVLIDGQRILGCRLR